MIPRLTWIDHLLLFVLAVGAVAGLTPLYQSGVGRPVLSVIKIAALVGAALFAVLTALRIRADHRVRPAWLIWAVGLSLYAVAQATLGFFQLRGLDPPFPSLGDAFFAAAVPFFLVALIWMAYVTVRSGLPLGRPYRYLRQAAGMLLLLGCLLYFVLVPLVHQPQDSRLALYLNVYYPVTSALILVPAMMLVRIAWHFRGGRIIWAWGNMMGGLVAVTISDILFAYVSTYTLPIMWNQVMTVCYLAGYIALFRGIVYYYQLMVSDESEAF